MGFITWDQAADISSHAANDGNTQTETAGGYVWRTRFYEDLFGDVVGSDWSANVATTESGGDMVVDGGTGGAINTVLNVTAGTDIDWFGRVTKPNLNSVPALNTDANPYTDGARWEAITGTSIRAVKIVDTVSTVVGSFTLAAGDIVRLNIQTSGSTVNWYKLNETTPDADWVLVATDSFTWDSNNKQLRIGARDSIANDGTWHSIGQRTGALYFPNTAKVTTITKSFGVSTIIPSRCVFTGATGTLRLRYNANGAGFSSAMSIATFQALSPITAVSTWQWDFDANDGGETALAGIQAIQLFRETNDIATFVGARVL